MALVITQAIKRLLPERAKVALYCMRDYHRYFGTYPNILSPRKFSDKIQRRKILDRDPRLPLLADKVAVKQIVSERLGPQYVIPTLWQGAALPPRDERTWPMPFVMKANHGSGWNVFVRTEQERDWNEIERRFGAWMRQSYAQEKGEWLYSRIVPKILVEPFIGKNAVLPLDYKLWAFGGRVHFIQIDTDREREHKRVFYDRTWRRLPFSYEFPIEPREIDRPSSLDRMIRLAEALAEDFSFVRVDLYEADANPIFGEITFYPESGYGRFSPADVDETVGALWA